jgi:prepilin-type N-terminal cleavage/methylation domain-containing protein
MTARGVTLVELMVAIAVLGFVLGLSGIALASLRQPSDTQTITAIDRARTQAILSGHRVSLRSLSDRVYVLFLPDGRVVGAGVDQLTGVPRADN